ncbi:MAG TPA: Rpn family recombination-promoting nuclease/putative transposase, partial [bacterium]|nr:Rpn family recombination-promoting nuclease/putative transposase [bacterium]
MTEPIQPHDRFFRNIFSNRETVEDIVFNNLPQIAAHLMPGTFENTDETFVNEELRKYVSDLLYRAKLRDGEDAYIYILFEHKSHPEPQVAFDLLRYMVRIWERFREEGTPRWFPHIIPIVFYHGRE